MNLVNPIVGQWYFSRETGRMLEVVSVDDVGTIEMQDFDGNLDEVDQSGWRALDVEAIEPPEDLDGAFDHDSDEVEGAARDAYRAFETGISLRAAWQGDPDQWNEGFGSPALRYL